LEAAFNRGANEVELFEDQGRHMYTVNLVSLEQMRLWTGRLRAVRRAKLLRAVTLDILHTQVVYKTKPDRFQWQVCETTGEGLVADRWRDFASDWNHQVGVSFHDDASVVNLLDNENVHVYTVDFAEFTQTNVSTGTVRAVRPVAITDKGA
jgi:hypothetical protein